MHPRMEELVIHLDVTRKEIHMAVASVAVDRHDVVPAEGRWSVAGVVAHLAHVEAGVMAMLREQLDRARAEGLREDSDTSSVLAMLEGDSIRRRAPPVETPPEWRPRYGIAIVEALSDLEASRISLLESMRAADGFALHDVSVPHPALGVLNLYQWIGFIGYHELRHADQIREIGKQLGDR